MIGIIHVLIIVSILLGVSIIVWSNNIIHAAYALALTLTGTAGMYVLMDAELLAVVQILVYAGGVVVLLSLGVMLTNRLRGESVVTGSRNKWIGAIISTMIFLGFSALIQSTDLRAGKVQVASDPIEQIGVALLTEHLLAFELIAFILLVALVGAAYLAKMSSDE
ncbi:MAG: NADH-quinone oxidoreductase subunit J [Ekhidna sp.]|nr:NADH-quinone oxidoreductase subunit J [Ekhidna sp.]